ncbi:rRNA maturation RNase YbeY [Jannaschia sp. EhC01]|nr:rRNA maturation RNase YbeY [Jannaschia sp. EhC01]
MEIDILTEAPQWDALDLEGLAQAAFTEALRDLSLDPDAFALSILACDDVRIATLNTEFRSKPTATNVLSWPTEDRAPDVPGTMPDLAGLPEELGDLALAYETCAREARDGGKPLADHVTHLLVHGLLHCLGFDHETDPDATLMEATETRILARLGVPDPY